MFFRDLVLKSNATKTIRLAEVRLPVRLGHRDADEAFGQPLARQLAAAGLGTVTTVKPHESAPSDICGITLYLALSDTRKATFQTVARMLDHLHAPLGSSIRHSTGGEPLLFGVAEGLELSIENEKAQDATARRDLAHTCSLAMKGFAINRGWTRRSGRTIFYFYGESFQRMHASLGKVIEGNPAFSNAKARRLA